MTLVFGIEILRVIIFVSGLAFFFATATTLAIAESINPKPTHFVSVSIPSPNLPRFRRPQFKLNYEKFSESVTTPKFYIKGKCDLAISLTTSSFTSCLVARANKSKCGPTRRNVAMLLKPADFKVAANTFLVKPQR